MKNYTLAKFRERTDWAMETRSFVKAILECGKSLLTEMLFGSMKVKLAHGGLMAMNLEVQR